MKQLLLLSSAFILAASSLNAQLPASHSGLGFTENKGQFKNQEGQPATNVLFKASGTGPGIFITDKGLTYLFVQKDEQPADTREENFVSTAKWSSIHMDLVGATILKENIVMEDELTGFANYYYPHCPQGILGVKSCHKITIKEIYPGIDWVITADDMNGVAHDFLVHPNGKHHQIVMKYEGLIAPITLNEKQQLTLTSAYGTIYEGGLKVIRKSDNRVLRSYFSITGNEVGYLIVRGARDGDIIIDPPLQWSLPQASTGMDYGTGVAATKDGTQEVLGCGYSDGSDFPVMNASQGTLSGQEDAVIYRLDGTGTRMWSTYFGGTDIDNCKGIATDLAGNAYVTGHTNSQDLPVMSSLQANYGGGVYDAFIAKFNPAGVMQWASWRGGTGTDFGTAITSDDAGTIYVVGYTNTTVNFPLLNPIQATLGGVYDGFVMRLNASQVMQWSTYYGGTDEDKFRAVTLDMSANNLVIAGNAMSGNFPTAGSPFQLFNAQAWFTSDAVIVKMTSNQSVVFASYCGGYEDDIATGVACDDAGNIYATGYTMSSDFPKVVQAGAYNDTSFNAIGVQDPFIVKCNASGTSLLWSTYFGGTGTDYGFAIAYDQFVGVYVCGNTASTDFPVMQPADLLYYQSTHGDGGNFNDMWIAWFNVNDTLSWSTYFGAANSEEAYGVSVEAQGDFFVTGVENNDISIAKFGPGLPTETTGPVIPGLEILIGPNPAANVMNVQFFSQADGITQIEIFDSRGRLVQTEQYAAAAGSNSYEVNIASLADGLYAMKLTTPKGETMHRFVKARIWR